MHAGSPRTPRALTACVGAPIAVLSLSLKWCRNYVGFSDLPLPLTVLSKISFW